MNNKSSMPDAEQKNTDVEKQEPAPAAEKTEGKKDENDDELEKVKEKRHRMYYLFLYLIKWGIQFHFQFDREIKRKTKGCICYNSIMHGISPAVKVQGER